MHPAEGNDLNQKKSGQPESIGLYDPRFEHDACGIGILADLDGRRTHSLVSDALELLARLSHRGGTGADPETGDGGGLLVQVPDSFLRTRVRGLPEAGTYGIGQLFLPRDRGRHGRCLRVVREEAERSGFRVLAWRRVPTDPEVLGELARASEPVVRQVFLVPAGERRAGDALERRLYLLRKRLQRQLADVEEFYVCSLSSRTLVLKGLLHADQLPGYYPDLRDEKFTSALALVHSRFSTNTFPTWARAQPMRMLVHNGEINTLEGNTAWMRAREGGLDTPAFSGDELKELLPVVEPGGSDSAALDNALELLVQTGTDLTAALSTLVPPAWQARSDLSTQVRDMHRFMRCLSEPWDGPAALGFTDGVRVGAALDRNGLRPVRYWLTTDRRLIMASEVGALDVPPEKVVRRGRLGPGDVLLADTVTGEIMGGEQLRAELARRHPYGEWLAANQQKLPLSSSEAPRARFAAELLPEQLTHGYTREDVERLLAPMALEGKVPVGSMGDDTPLAVLSERGFLVYDYLKQRFAQVTNPPLDCLRERSVTSLETLLGTEGNLLSPGPRCARRLRLTSPILDHRQMHRLRRLEDPELLPNELDLTFPVAAGPRGLEIRLRELVDEALERVAAGARLLVLTDRGVGESRAPVSALLALGAVHHGLVGRGCRTGVSLIVDSSEPRQVHHVAALLGYGAGAVHPRLALETVRALAASGELEGRTESEAVDRYKAALETGLLKVMAKMGISVVQAYRGSQLFEAVGLSQELVDLCLRGTPTRIGGAGLLELGGELLERHTRAYPGEESRLPDLGLYRWRKKGVPHAVYPAMMRRLHAAVREESWEDYREYTQLVQGDSAALGTLRSLLEFAPGAPVPLEEVEPVESLVRRMTTGAMSYGSLSQEAHETLAIAMNELGARSNSGEGGEDPDRDGTRRRSATRQVASGRFGVTTSYLVGAEEIQIKMAQGAKPGEGGHLPAHKVHPWIARTRHSTPFVGLISPPPHHDIYSIEDLAQLIFDLRSVNPRAEISVKLASEIGVGTVAAGVAKAGADRIVVSGYSGGTGAAALESIRHAGAPWELGVAETHQTLSLNRLRSRVRLQTDGGLRTGRDVAVAALLGAESFGFGTAALLASGCIMRRICHTDRCPVGIATQNPTLRAKYPGRPEHVIRFMLFVARELRELMASLGFRRLDEMIGRVDVLRPSERAEETGLDLGALLTRVEEPQAAPVSAPVLEASPSLDEVLARKLREPLREGRPACARARIENTDRAVGARLGGELVRIHGRRGLPEGTLQIRLAGSAGQSLAAFLPRGLSLHLEGEANDYLAKGLSGGEVVVTPPIDPGHWAPLLVGNVSLYGATGGSLFVRGQAGERFAVRNSGAMAVVEGVGDHACEYMTGGRVLILGEVGRNFAAGMSGGIAYVHDPVGRLASRLNPEMVELEGVVDPERRREVEELLRRHVAATGSPRAAELLQSPEAIAREVRAVIPVEYRKVLESRPEHPSLLGQGRHPVPALRGPVLPEVPAALDV